MRPRTQAKPGFLPPVRRSVLSIKKVGSFRLVKLRNPWSTGERNCSRCSHCCMFVVCFAVPDRFGHCWLVCRL